MRATPLALLLLILARAASAEPSLLAVCQALDDVRCTRATEWSVSKTTDTPLLTNPVNEPARFRITVTEGPTQRWITLRGALTVTGLMSPGTTIRSIVLNLQKYDGATQAWTNVASAAVGDASARCECPFIQGGDLAVRVWDPSGNSVPAVPGAILSELPFGETAFISLDGRYNLAAGVVSEQDQLRISTCISYRQTGVSWPPGCFLDGGAIFNVQACSDLPSSVCAEEQQTIRLREELQELEPAMASVGSFTAVVSSPTITPGGTQTLQAGGDALEYVVAATGVEGTQSIIDLSGKISCQGVCADPAGCHGTLTNTASLIASESWPDALDTPINGSPAHATIDVVCRSSSPPPIAVGDFCTFTQGGWGAACRGSNPGCLLNAGFAAVFGASTSCASIGGLVVGAQSPGVMKFTTAAAVTAYLPAGGPARVLTGGPLCNPVRTSAGVFGGQLTALKLSISFSDAGRLPQRSTQHLGDLVMTNGPCAGLTAREILSRGERALSGLAMSGACSTIADLNEAADRINNNFVDCRSNLGALELP